MQRVATSSVPSFDGTSIAAHHFGGGDATPLLLVNAIGPDLSTWTCVGDALASQRKVVSWDLRGLHGSEQPASERVDAAAHAEDAIAVLDASGVDRFVLATWSTGTRIALEIARSYPERVAAVAVICGGVGRGFRGLFRYLEVSSVFPMGAGLAKHFAPTLEGPFRAFVRRPEIAGVVRQSGVIGPSADIDALVKILQSFAETDLRRLLTIFEEVVGDSDPEVLSQVQVPTLLVAGQRDRFTTPAMVRDMGRRLPYAETVLYEKGSHFIPIEYPERLVGDLTGFFDLYSR